MTSNDYSVIHIRIKFYDVLVISAAIWSILQTRLNSIYFTTISGIYLFSAVFSFTDTVLNKNVWTNCIKMLDETAVIISLPLIATQLCFLCNFYKEVAFCNLIPPFIELLILKKYPEYRMITTDYTAVLQILIIVYIAYSLLSLKMALISFIYSKLYYGTTDNISIPHHNSYGFGISLVLIFMGLIVNEEKITEEEG